MKTPFSKLILSFFVISVSVYSLSSQDSGEAKVELTPPTIYKSNLETSISIGPRLGNIWWQCQIVPPGASNQNGIRGSYIFNGPTIPAIGVGMRIGFTKLLRLAPSIDFIFDEYVYRSDLGRAFMTQNMTGSSVGPVATVLGIMISVPLWFDIPINDRLVFSLSPGIAIYPRLALIPIDNSTGIEAISGALNANLGWLYPQTGLSIKYALDSTTNIGFEIQVLYPLSHIGSNDGMGLDGLMITGMFGIDFYL